MVKLPCPPYVRQPPPPDTPSRLLQAWYEAENKREEQYNEECRLRQLAEDRREAAEKKRQEEASKPKPGPGGNVGGKPGKQPKGGSGGDSTASTDDAVTGQDPPGTPSNPEEKICKCLSGVMDRVAAALTDIAAILTKQERTAQEQVEALLSEIIDQLNSRLGEPVRTCEQCKDMARAGLAGTLEYAIACAGKCVDDAKKECSLGDESTWGKPCDKCGQECCRCNQGVCEPEPCPPKWVGWCDSETGVVVVLKEGESPPKPTYRKVSIDKEKAVADRIAREQCQTYKQPSGGGEVSEQPIEPKPGGRSTQPIQVPNALCNFAEFISGAGAARVNNTSVITNMADGYGEAVKSISSFGFEGLNLRLVGEAVEGAIRSIFGGPRTFMTDLIPTAIGALGCDDPTFLNAVRQISAIENIAKVSNCDLSPWMDQLRYVANARCRQQFMTPDQALAAYLANAIDYRTLDGHWAIANICTESLDSTLKASRAKPIPLQLAVMRRREIIDEKGYADGMRQLGYLETSVAENLFKITEQVPPLSEIIRYMVRDTDDSGLVSKFQLDAKFTDKYGDQLKKWAKAQGIPDEIAKHSWRAHWSIPAPGQLFTFYQRLRDNPKFGGRDKVLEDVKDALIQQDILPYWHEHYLATSFHPLGRIDIRRAFNNGTLPESDLVPAYQQLGYSDENSERLATFSKRLRRDSALNHRAVKQWQKFLINKSTARERILADGLPDEVADFALSEGQAGFLSTQAGQSFVRGDLSRTEFTDRLESAGVDTGTAAAIADQLALKITDHPAIKGYIVGVLSDAEAKNQMVEYGMSPQVVDNLLNAANQAIDFAGVVACQKGIKRRYLMGELSREESINALVNSGTSSQRASRLVGLWDCEKSSLGKAVPAARLCKWLEMGVISSLEFADRLNRLGYDPADSARMRDDCLAAISVKRQKQAEKEARDQVALERREQAAQAKQAAAIQRLAAQQLAATRKAQQTKANRERQLMSAAVKLGKKVDGELFDAMQAVRANYSRITREYGLGPDEALATLIKAAESFEGDDLPMYDFAVDTLAEGTTAVAESV